MGPLWRTSVSPFLSRLLNDLRTVLTVKGSLRRALDCYGQPAETQLIRGKGELRNPPQPVSILFPARVTSTEHQWVIPGERRREISPAQLFLYR